MPSRRHILTTLPAVLAGCTSSSPVNRPTETSTVTPPEMIDECRAIPEPPTSPTQAEAREFVAAYEEARIYNWLVSQNDGPDECRPDGPGSSASAAGVAGATEVTIEGTQTAVVAETSSGYYVVSSCSARAAYWCRDEGRTCSHAGRNADFVTHYVSNGHHARIPHNWFVCHARADPYRVPDTDKNISLSAEEPGLTFRVYLFADNEDEADVSLTYLDADEQVLQETYTPNVGPAVQSNVTVATGEYRLVVETADERAVHEFSVTGQDDAAWNGFCVYLGPDGLHIVEITTDGELAVPEGTCYDHRTEETESGDSGLVKTPRR